MRLTNILIESVSNTETWLYLWVTFTNTNTGAMHHLLSIIFMFAVMKWMVSNNNFKWQSQDLISIEYAVYK